jgi:hypothetical protein
MTVWVWHGFTRVCDSHRTRSVKFSYLGTECDAEAWLFLILLVLLLFLEARVEIHVPYVFLLVGRVGTYIVP